MGRGLSQRRRVANVLKARQERSGLSNVLPPPPKEETGKLPRALRNMLAFKSAMEKKEQSTREAKAKGRDGARVFKKKQESGREEEALPSSSLADAFASAASAAAAAAAPPRPPSPPPPTPAPSCPPRPPPKPSAFEEEKDPSSRKERRKARSKLLKQKKKEKKRKSGGGGGGGKKEGESDDEQGRSIYSPSSQRSRPRPAALEEQATAPIKVTLKRRHWIENGGAQSGNGDGGGGGGSGEGGAKTSSSSSLPGQRVETAADPARLARVFKSQMATAVAREEARSCKQGRKSKKQKTTEAAGASSRRPLLASSSGSVSAEQRLAVIEAYRASKAAAERAKAEEGSAPSLDAFGAATKSSLAALVRDNAARAVSSSAARKGDKFF